MFTIMENRKRARVELVNSPALHANTNECLQGVGVATSTNSITIGGQSFILSNAGSSSLPANILLSICDDNSDESEEYIIDNNSVLTQIKQENTVATQTLSSCNTQPATSQLLTTVPQYRIINQAGKKPLNNTTSLNATAPTTLVSSPVTSNSTLIPTSMQLSSGCEIYVIKEIVEPPKQLLSDSSSPHKARGSNTTIKLEPMSPSPASTTPGSIQILRTAAASSATSSNQQQQQSIASNLNSITAAVNGATNIISNQEDSSKRSLILEAYKKRDDKRRATHNEVERRRRDKINSWIFKLKEMLPSDVNMNVVGGGSAQAATLAKDQLTASNTTARTPPSDSKSQILIKACEYIKSMQEEIQSLRECLTENENLRLSNQRLQDELNNLRNKQQQQQQQQQRQQHLLNNNSNSHNHNSNNNNTLLLSTNSDDDECEITLNSLNTTYANVQLFSPNAGVASSNHHLSAIIGPTTTATSTTSNSGITYAKRELIIRDYVD